MGRQQVQPALRQAVQQHSANPKLQQQQKQQQQQLTKQARPLSSNAAPSNTTKQQTANRPQTAQPQVKQQPQKQQPTKQSNAQVYRPTPVKEHPDDAFISGAWLFDESRIPQWMATQLPKQQTLQKHHKQLQQKQQQQPIARPTSSASSASANKQSLIKQNVNAQVYRPTPVKEHPDDAFTSGAWLFDESRIPQWMASQLPKQQQQQQQRVQSAVKMSVTQRPTSASLPHQQQPVNKPNTTKPVVNKPSTTQPIVNKPSTKQQDSQRKQQARQHLTMQHGDDPFLWNEWTPGSRQPLWTMSHSTAPPTMQSTSLPARPQSPPTTHMQQPVNRPNTVQPVVNRPSPAQQPKQQHSQKPQQHSQQARPLSIMQNGDDMFLWNGWTPASGQPLWTMSNSTMPSMKQSRNLNSRPQSPPTTHMQKSQNQTRPSSSARC